MRINHAIVGTVPGPGHLPVESYTLDSGRGYAIEVWSYGATLVEARVPDRRGSSTNVVRRLPSLADYVNPRKNAYLGATVGRYCRCIAGGRFQLDGVVHHLSRNAGAHHIHGGTKGFDRAVWSSDASRDGDRLSVWFTLISPDGDQGYPGTLTAQTSYHLEGDGRLTFEHRATTTASTVVGFTNHAFWNLAGEGTVGGHWLALNSSRMVAFDSELIPLPGPPVSVAGGALDFTESRPIGVQRLDNFFVLRDPAFQPQDPPVTQGQPTLAREHPPLASDPPALAAELFEPTSGRAMRVSSDDAGIGVYTGDAYLDPRAGICLETGPWPDAPNRPDFPSVRLDPDVVYHRRTVHEFAIR